MIEGERMKWACLYNIMANTHNPVPYRSSLRYNTMVHDVMSWLQIEAFIYSRLKGREICQRALLAPPARSTIIPLRAPRSASFETSQDGVNISEYISNAYHSQKSFVCFRSLRVGELSGSLTLTSSGRHEIHWLNSLA